MAKKVEAFDSAKIREHIKYARYKSGSNLHPLKGETEPDPRKAGAYTWMKAPRYNNEPMEVGPLARVAAAIWQAMLMSRASSTAFSRYSMLTFLQLSLFWDATLPV